MSETANMPAGANKDLIRLEDRWQWLNQARYLADEHLNDDPLDALRIYTGEKSGDAKKILLKFFDECPTAYEQVADWMADQYAKGRL